MALHPLDGATIKRVIDDWGRTPQPFQDNGALVHPVAYQQILKGYPAVDYAARDIIYAPRNPRPNRVYGFSPVEQIVMTANNHASASSEPDDPKNKPPPAAEEAPKEPVAAAGAPAPDPEDPEAARGQGDASSQTPKKPSYQIGASDGGPGQWVEANENTKPADAAYQQKVTGAPQGTVYNVPNTNAPTGVVSFDGYDPATNTLIDAKNWNKWPIDEGFSSDWWLSKPRARSTRREERT